MRAKVQPPVIERPGRIVVGRGLGEFLRKGRAQRFAGEKFKVAMEHESAQILLEFPIACYREARFLEAGLHVLKSSGPQSSRRTFRVREQPWLGELPQPA